jgi:dipeptidyl aminopeptidase/acylaminoacyl peptidase
MERYLVIAISTTVLIVLILPVLITQVIGKESRSFQGVRLEDTSYQEISFQNLSQGIKLGGMLFIPDGEGPFPAAVIIHGSETSRRDSKWHLTLTQYLQNNGVVVLLPDKRGSEQSEGDWHTSSFEDLATDTLAAVSFLKDQDNVAVSSIGVIGMSQGGRIAPIVANKTTDVAFLVNVVGGAVTAREQHLFKKTTI